MPRVSVVVRLVASAAFLAAGPGIAAGLELFAGGYSFSDELGGFRLIAVSGEGSASDPIVVVEEIPSTDAVTLVIRRAGRTASDIRPELAQLTLVKEVRNRSNRVWAGFEIELQEVLGEPSDYGDGLSFKQFAATPDDVGSDVFQLNDRRFEPADRIAFLDGAVDPGETVRFRMTITDPTPVPEFYLRQDPNLLSAGLATPERSVASR